MVLPLVIGGAMVGGSILSGMGARKEAARRAAAVNAYREQMQALQRALEARMSGEAESRQGNFLAALQGMAPGALMPQAQEDQAASVARVQAATGPAPEAFSAPNDRFGSARSSATQAGMRGVNEQAGMFSAQALMRALSERQGQKLQSADTSNRMRDSALSWDQHRNQVSQAQAQAQLQAALGDYSRSGANMQLAGGTLQGLGSLGAMMYGGGMGA